MIRDIGGKKGAQRQSQTGRGVLYARGCAWERAREVGEAGVGPFWGLALACACLFFQKSLRARCACRVVRACARGRARESAIAERLNKSSVQQRDPRALPRQSLRTSPGRLDALSVLPPVLQAPPQAGGPQHTHGESLQHVHTKGIPRHHSELSVGYALPAAQHPDGIPCNLNRSAKVTQRPRDGK